MKLQKTPLLMTLATALVMSLAAPVFAQGPAMPEPDQAQMSEKMQKHWQDRMEKHRAMMHDQLKITPEQETAWKAFTEATAHNMKEHMASRPDRKQMEAMSAPAMMEKHLERGKERVAMMQKHLDALKSFYATLTPEQQKTFDRLHHRMHRRMQMMHSKGTMRGKAMERGHDMDHAAPNK